MKFELTETVRLNYVLLIIMVVLMLFVNICLIGDCIGKLEKYSNPTVDMMDMSEFEGVNAKEAQVLAGAQLRRFDEYCGNLKLVIACSAAAVVAYFVAGILLLLRYRSSFKVLICISVVSTVVLFVVMSLSFDGVNGAGSIKYAFGFLAAAISIVRFANRVNKEVNADIILRETALRVMREYSGAEKSPAVRELNDSAETERIFNAPVSRPMPAENNYTAPETTSEDVKGMWFCGGCGTLNEGTAVCKQCGRTKE